MEFEAAALRQQDDWDGDLVLAYQTAVFATQAFNGKLDDLRVILARRRGRPRQQSRAEQRQVLAQLSKQYGLTLREKVH